MRNLRTARRVSNKIGRLFNSNATTFPYLSGDVFAANSDLIIPKGFSAIANLRQKIQNSKVIFCDGYQAEEFLEVFGQSMFGKVLIVGNSDKDWFHFPIEKAPDIKAVFLQNSFIEHELIFTLPIGIENISYFQNGRSRNFGSRFVSANKVDSVLVGPFSPTHEIRKNINHNLVNSNRVHILNTEKIDSYTYANYASNFGFIASPRGNGEDTHRTWESLYRGSTPVLLRNKWADSLKSLNLPIVLIDEWSIDQIDSLPAFQTFNPLSIESLWWPYWKSRFSSFF